jgi:hypothetical protein
VKRQSESLKRSDEEAIDVETTRWLLMEKSNRAVRKKNETG